MAALVLLAAFLVVSIVRIARRPAEPEPTPEATQTPETVVITPEPTPTPEVVKPASFAFPYEVKEYAAEPDNTSGYKTSWGTEVREGYVTPTFGYNEISIDTGGEGVGLESGSVYRDGIPFINGTTITVRFNAYGSIARNIRVAAVIADANELYTETPFAITTENQVYEMSFKCNRDTIWNGRIAFQVGYDGPHSVDNNTVVLSHIRITSSAPEQGVRINQLGYLTYGQKRCTFPYNCGDGFDVINADTNENVYTGAIVYGVNDETTGENNYYGDCPAVTQPGSYYIQAQTGVTSPVFVISESPYAALDDSLLRMISLQRCGVSLDSSWAGDLAHAECHTGEANAWQTQIYKDVSGGWHDAGDYGRYVKTGAKAASDLLWAYIFNPAFCTDASAGPDSGNGVPDVLDEARFELEWMLKMQSDYKGVYTKAVTPSFAEFIDPAEDHQNMILIDPESTSTATFVGTMATASLVYREIDPDFADRCLQAAKVADEFLDDHPENVVVLNPESVSAGAYLDDNDQEVRFYAKAALYAATGDKRYLEGAKQLYSAAPANASGLSWQTQGAYGKFILLAAGNLQSDDADFYNTMLSSLESEANGLLSRVDSNSYNSSLYDYGWGSNGKIAENGMILSMAYRMTGDMRYQQAAVEQVNYLLGKNCLNICFVSGFGNYYPHHVHSRIASARGVELHGALVGGSDMFREDPVMQGMPWDTPAAKFYSDTLESFSTNEITVYWNSAFIALLSAVTR
ncbi:MAG: glycoside hydrolase family 9 protein [Solobacterium sp.]|nr:glycoside hydrolase family 9 protein [Solobacterium sp.]